MDNKSHLFYAPDIDSVPVLPEDESLHCTRVLRLKEGDSITITDGKGYFYSANIESIHFKHCKVNITKRWQPKTLRNYKIHIAIAPTKNMDRMEWFVEKATEIGIDAITCLHCRHSERSEIKLQRLYKTAISAMKQSQKALFPIINEMTYFYDFLSSEQNAIKMIAHCADSNKQLIKDIYAPDNNALILIGPEGDFSPDEIKVALSVGFAPVTLGEYRLRTETAALTACLTIHLINQ